MAIEQLPSDFRYLKEMYEDDYFPNELVDKIKIKIQGVVNYIEQGGHSITDIQDKFDDITNAINELQEEFEENGSEIETGARESIGETVKAILEHFKIGLDIEDAIRARDW